MTKLRDHSKDALVRMALSVQKCTLLIVSGRQREPSNQENQQGLIRASSCQRGMGGEWKYLLFSLGYALVLSAFLLLRSP